MLQNPLVDTAVFEVARGGILREGLGYDRNDVAVVTNVTGDLQHPDDLRSLPPGSNRRMRLADAAQLRRDGPAPQGEAGPGLHRLAALDHLGVVARHLPGAIDPPVRARWQERHHLDVFRSRLIVVKQRRRLDRIENAGAR